MRRWPILLAVVVGGCTVQIMPIILPPQKAKAVPTTQPTSQPASRPATEQTVMDYMRWILHGND